MDYPVRFHLVEGFKCEAKCEVNQQLPTRDVNVVVAQHNLAFERWLAALISGAIPNAAL